MLARPPLPTAILCSNDLTAVGALRALAEAGVRVPQDVSVVGFDDIDFARLAHPPLTTVRLSRDQLGRLAFEALQKIMRSKQRQGSEYLLETQLLIRQSTAQVRSHSCDVQTPTAASEEAPSPPDPQIQMASRK
jgi:LacI family transcriptional regulator